MIDDNEYLLESLREDRNQTLLMEVAWLSFSLFEFLVQFPQDFSVVDFTESNIIHCIVVNGDDDDRVMMLKSLKDEITRETFACLINHLDVGGNSPLHLATWCNHQNTIKFLIKNGANVNIRNKSGQFPEEKGWCNDKTKKLILSYRS